MCRRVFRITALDSNDILQRPHHQEELVRAFEMPGKRLNYESEVFKLYIPTRSLAVQIKSSLTILIDQALFILKRLHAAVFAW
jgi:hypothetical protein